MSSAIESATARGLLLHRSKAKPSGPMFVSSKETVPQRILNSLQAIFNLLRALFSRTQATEPLLDISAVVEPAVSVSMQTLSKKEYRYVQDEYQRHRDSLATSDDPLAIFLRQEREKSAAPLREKAARRQEQRRVDFAGALVFYRLAVDAFDKSVAATAEFLNDPRFASKDDDELEKVEKELSQKKAFQQECYNQKEKMLNELKRLNPRKRLTRNGLDLSDEALEKASKIYQSANQRRILLA